MISTRSSRRSCVEDFPAITLADLPDDVTQRPPPHLRQIRLLVDLDGVCRAFDVELTVSSQHFGGHRCWFRCRCGRRAGRLLLFDKGICRRCARLPHLSQLRRRPLSSGLESKSSQGAGRGVPRPRLG